MCHSCGTEELHVKLCQITVFHSNLICRLCCAVLCPPFTHPILPQCCLASVACLPREPPSAPHQTDNRAILGPASCRSRPLIPAKQPEPLITGDPARETRDGGCVQPCGQGEICPFILAGVSVVVMVGTHGARPCHGKAYRQKGL